MGPFRANWYVTLGKSQHAVTRGRYTWRARDHVPCRGAGRTISHGPHQTISEIYQPSRATPAGATIHAGGNQRVLFQSGRRGDRRRRAADPRRCLRGTDQQAPAGRAGNRRLQRGGRRRPGRGGAAAHRVRARGRGDRGRRRLRRRHRQGGRRCASATGSPARAARSTSSPPTPTASTTRPRSRPCCSRSSTARPTSSPAHDGWAARRPRTRSARPACGSSPPW
jgi:hypothetical protein